MVRPQRARSALDSPRRARSQPAVHRLDRGGGGDPLPRAGGQPGRPRPRRADRDVPLGGRYRGFPRPLRRGAADRRRRRAAPAQMGLRPLPPADAAHDRRSRKRALRRPRDRRAQSHRRGLQRRRLHRRRGGASATEPESTSRQPTRTSPTSAMPPASPRRIAKAGSRATRDPAARTRPGRPGRRARDRRPSTATAAGRRPGRRRRDPAGPPRRWPRSRRR
jgi:hypothetical protein